MGMNMMHRFGDGKSGAAITVRITPRSGRDEITGVLENGTVKIRLKAAPVEGQANSALIKFLADVLSIAPSKIEIVAGHTSKDKLITILGLDSTTVQERIMARIA
jgi:uncharacterized protein